ncbi:MAG: hypothetical protein AAFU79_29200, partial [Myxococcota bacterium]
MANVSAARGSLPILGLTSEAFAHHARERVGPGHGVWRQVYRAAFEGRFAPEELGVSSAAIERWRSAFHVDLAAPARRVDEPSLHPVDVGGARGAPPPGRDSGGGGKRVEGRGGWGGGA